MCEEHTHLCLFRAFTGKTSQRPVTPVTKGPVTICDTGGDHFPGQPPKRRNPSLCPLVKVPDGFPAFVLLQALGCQRSCLWGHVPEVDGVQFSCLVELNSNSVQLDSSCCLGRHRMAGVGEGVSTAPKHVTWWCNVALRSSQSHSARTGGITTNPFSVFLEFSIGSHPRLE